MKWFRFLFLFPLIILFVISCSNEENNISEFIRIYNSNILTIPEIKYEKDGATLEKLVISREDLDKISLRYDSNQVRSHNPNYKFSGVAIYTFDDISEGTFPIAILPPDGVISVESFSDFILDGVSIQFIASRENLSTKYIFDHGVHADYEISYGQSRAVDIVQFFGSDTVSLSLPYDEMVEIRITPENGWRVSGYYINDAYFPCEQANTGTYMRGSVGYIGTDNDWSASFSIIPTVGIDSYRIRFDVEKLKFLEICNEDDYRFEIFRDSRFRDRIPTDNTGKSGIFVSGNSPIYLYVRDLNEDVANNPALSSLERIKIKDISPVNKKQNEWYYEISFPSNIHADLITLNIDTAEKAAEGSKELTVQNSENVIVLNQNGVEVAPSHSDGNTTTYHLIEGQEYSLLSDKPLVSSSVDFIEMQKPAESKNEIQQSVSMDSVIDDSPLSDGVSSSHNPVVGKERTDLTTTQLTPDVNEKPKATEPDKETSQSDSSIDAMKEELEVISKNDLSIDSSEYEEVSQVDTPSENASQVKEEPSQKMYSYSIVASDQDMSATIAIPDDEAIEYDERCTYRIGSVDYTGNPGVSIEENEIVTVKAALRYEGEAFSEWSSLPSDSDKKIDGNIISFKFKVGEPLPVPVYVPAEVISLPALAEGFTVEYFDVDGNLKRPGDKITVLPGDELFVQINTPENIKDAEFYNPGAGFFSRKEKLKPGEWQDFSFKVNEDGQIDISIEM